jgi:hypothetical protein
LTNLRATGSRPIDLPLDSLASADYADFRRLGNTKFAVVAGVLA